MGIEQLTNLFLKVAGSFDFQIKQIERTVQYKICAQSVRLFGLHSNDVKDAHRPDAHSSPKKIPRATAVSKWENFQWHGTMQLLQELQTRMNDEILRCCRPVRRHCFDAPKW